MSCVSIFNIRLPQLGTEKMKWLATQASDFLYCHWTKANGEWKEGGALSSVGVPFESIDAANQTAPLLLQSKQKKVE